MSLDDVRERVAARRRLARLGDSPSTAITLCDAEALCDLADGARRWIDASERMDINEVARAEATIRAALARLDGEDTG